ncbi:hypothetical protein [Inconstantimicrobium mannanitabidum]|uniref:Uncharacterized protein n=1 Tax=Inconstantimicrobium mannanitabidum TaxID=1604901 RepID=A0ACB5REB1_9CLOT|nr:hypothetical protein [Clostridium sp. TW13]GKX67378.1 hypothetical protein rsdtw13_26360 [Clostridium sp. TW13]
MTTVLTKPVFEDIIDNLDESSISIIESDLNTQRLTKNTRPTNQEIIDAAKANYIEYSDFIDNNAYFTRNYCTDRDNNGRIKDLNITDWDKNPSFSLMEQIGEQTATETNTAGCEFIFPSLMIGINADAELRKGGGGGVGTLIDRARQSSEGTRFFTYYMGKVGLQINKNDNFMVGAFKDHPSVLRNLTFCGLEIVKDIGVPIKLDLFFDKNLEFLGFTSSMGGGVQEGARVFAGHFYTE